MKGKQKMTDERERDFCKLCNHEGDDLWRKKGRVEMLQVGNDIDEDKQVDSYFWWTFEEGEGQDEVRRQVQGVWEQ